ncbi:DinB family protein [Paenibacillus ginsengarvi]|uniref:Damage-inducible protein DinB n=1 Tax=Paenibacillus ginsengarvi TaxID=400777 RepID=A0A3B0B0P3_9BACL|nr:DinB family protein [Paenibacillus ginsengarvi]RKN66082.1 damage-inducible protein DinB [Paenibacillus ginsengarvi]
MTHYAIEMYDFHVWANETMFRRLKELPPEVYTQQVKSVFPSVSIVMAHIHMTDLSWLDTMSGINMSEAMAGTLSMKEQIEAYGIEELEASYAALAERYKVFLREQPDLDKSIVLDNPYAGVRDTRLSEMVLQVVNHGTYHRGNVTAMLRQMGHASTMTEYGLYWYSKR